MGNRPSIYKVPELQLSFKQEIRNVSPEYKFETWMDEEEISFTWVIRNFTGLRTTNETYLRSECFKLKNDKWLLEIFQSTISREYLSLHLIRKKGIFTAKINPRCLITIVSSKANLQRDFKSNDRGCSDVQLGNYCFIKISELEDPENAFVVDGNLTIFCRLCIKGTIRKSFQKCVKEEPYLPVGIEHLSTNMKQLLNSRTDADVTIVTATKSFRVHKIILKSRSPVFQKMFETEMLESKTNVVTIEDFDERAVGGMLSYIYTGTTENYKNTLQLLKISEKYSISGMKEDTEAALIQDLHEENAAEYLLAAHLFNASRLKQISMQFITNNKIKIMKTKGFQLLAKENPLLYEFLAQN